MNELITLSVTVPLWVAAFAAAFLVFVTVGYVVDMACLSYKHGKLVGILRSCKACNPDRCPARRLMESSDKERGETH